MVIKNGKKNLKILSRRVSNKSTDLNPLSVKLHKYKSQNHTYIRDYTLSGNLRTVDVYTQKKYPESIAV